jgi:two-component system, response regulator
MSYSDVMIVEDNIHDIEMIMDALHDTGRPISTIVFRDGAEVTKHFFDPANQSASENMQLPKLILLDLKLPKINGLEVLKILRSDEKTKYIPIVIFTSSNEKRDRMESYQLGANSYLVKPLDADMFSHYIKEIVNYWAIMNTNTQEAGNN